MQLTLAIGALLGLAVVATPPLVLAQTPGTVSERPAGEVRRLTVEDAVRTALEHNLGVQIARLDPQIQDLSVAHARAAWAPTFSTTVQSSSTDSPSNSFLSGALGTKTSDDRLATTIGIEQPLPWGGRYAVGWDSSRSITTNLFSNFSPQLRSSVALTYRQPLLRGFAIDSARQQLLISRTNRNIADERLRQRVTVTTRAVRNAYWDLAYAIASLEVQRQSLELAQQSLRNTRARVEIGTTAPIDVVEAEAEVATREEAIILAEAQIARAQDALRVLVYEPSMPDFWFITIEPVDAPQFQPVVVDIDAAVRNALDRRTDLHETRETLEANEIDVRFFRNETLPDVTAEVDYGLTGLGGTQLVRGAGFPGPVIGQRDRSFGTVISDLFSNDFPNWTATLRVSYPIGTDQREATLARARLQYGQSQAQLREQELQVAIVVREAGRQVQTNQRRVETTRASRELAKRRLDAEERKFAAGTSTTFFVFQAQRDLAQARNNELRAILDYNRSIVDFETVQEVPLE